MTYKVIECHPSSDDLQGKLSYWANRGYALKAIVPNIASKDGWLTLVFEAH